MVRRRSGLAFLALVSSSGVFGGFFAAGSETLDITVKARFGMMLGALVCAIANGEKTTMPPAGALGSGMIRTSRDRWMGG